MFIQLEKKLKDIGIVEAGKGLTNVANGEMIRFGISEEGLVLHLEKSAVVLSSDETIHLKPGQVDGNWIQYVPKTWHLLSKPLKKVMEVSTTNKNWNPNFDNLSISKMWTSEYFKKVIPPQEHFEGFFSQKNLTAAEKRYCSTHFNGTYSTLEKVLDLHYGFSLPVGETKEHNLVLYGILSSWEHKKPWNEFNTIVPPSELIAEGVSNRSGASYLTRTVVIKLDKKYNPKDFFQKVTENELKMKGFEQIERTKVVDYFLRSIKEEYPCLELDSYFYQMLLMSKVFEMSHQGYKVDEIEETMRKNKEDLIAEYRELIKNMNIKDE